MAKDNRVQLPSSMGGLVRYDAESKSSMQFAPEVVVVMVIAVIAVVIGMHLFLA